MGKNIIILGINADIGMNIAQFYANDGYRVIGTYRKENENTKELIQSENIEIFKCDICNSEDINAFYDYLKYKEIKWDCIFSSIGTSKPIGRFFDTPFNEWENSININTIGPLKLIHKVYSMRKANHAPSIILMAGGGTNNPFRNYSAYCIAKIMLIKMCELLYDENPDLNIYIVGPGFVKTKTHLQTLEAKEKAGENYLRVKKFCESGDQGTLIKDIYDCIIWLGKQEKKLVSGRNFSVVHDGWGKNELLEFLEENDNNYKLRRFGNNKGN